MICHSVVFSAVVYFSTLLYNHEMHHFCFAFFPVMSSAKKVKSDKNRRSGHAQNFKTAVFSLMVARVTRTSAWYSLFIAFSTASLKREQNWQLIINLRVFDYNIREEKRAVKKPRLIGTNSSHRNKAKQNVKVSTSPNWKRFVTANTKPKWASSEWGVELCFRLPLRKLKLEHPTRVKAEPFNSAVAFLNWFRPKTSRKLTHFTNLSDLTS